MTCEAESEGKVTINKRSMNFFDVFAFIASFCCIIFGIIIHHGKYNDMLFRFNILSDVQKKRISRRYQSLLFGISCFLLGGLFVFHYYNIYQNFEKYCLIIISLFCFWSVFLGLQTSWIIEKARKKNR
jgi:hypothetical protein